MLCLYEEVIYRYRIDLIWKEAMVGDIYTPREGENPIP